MQCVPCIYAIHTLYSHGTYIVFNMIPRHLHWKLYSLVKYMTCLVIHTSTQRIAMTFIDVGYTCDVNTVTLLLTSIINHMISWLISLVYKHVCLRNEIRCHCDSTALPRRLIRRTSFKMCKLNGNDLRIPRT